MKQITFSLQQVPAYQTVVDTLLVTCQWRTQKISEGRAKEAMLPKKKFENIVILCFERRFSKQNSAIRPKFNILVYTAEY